MTKFLVPIMFNKSGTSTRLLVVSSYEELKEALSSYGLKIPRSYDAELKELFGYEAFDKEINVHKRGAQDQMTRIRLIKYNSSTYVFL